MQPDGLHCAERGTRLKLIMKYLTQLQDKPVVHPDGERLGKIIDVVVTADDPLPTVSAFQIKTEDGGVFLPAASIDANFDGRECKLKSPFTQIAPYQIHENDFSLVRDVLDRQIVDVHDYRVVRVNDIILDTLPDGRIALAVWTLECTVWLADWALKAP